jgi:Fe-S-cluster-containing dehydrogenase component
MKESTRKILKKHGWRIDLFIHEYIYFVFYVPYIRVVLLLTRFTDRFISSWCKPPVRIIAGFIFNRYHGKVLTPDDVRKIVNLDQDIRSISDENKRIIPYSQSTKIIFENPGLIVAMDCPCKIATDAPCRPLNSCMAIGDPIASFWLENCQKYNPRIMTADEAMEHIKKLRATGHFQQVFSKKSTHGQTYSICNCCKVCCASWIGTKAAKKVDRKLSQTAPSGYSVYHDSSKCSLCGTCVEICSFNANRITEGILDYDREECVGCELCVEHCPNGARKLYLDKDRDILPLDIDLIKKRSG